MQSFSKPISSAVNNKFIIVAQYPTTSGPRLCWLCRTFSMTGISTLRLSKRQWSGLVCRGRSWSSMQTACLRVSMPAISMPSTQRKLPSSWLEVFIPKILFITSDMSYESKRVQFPVRVSYAMIINKSQGQTLKVAGIDLINSLFSHGQLYVTCCQVGSARNLHMLAPSKRKRNIVYPRALM